MASLARGDQEISMTSFPNCPDVSIEEMREAPSASAEMEWIAGFSSCIFTKEIISAKSEGDPIVDPMS